MSSSIFDFPHLTSRLIRTGGEAETGAFVAGGAAPPEGVVTGGVVGVEPGAEPGTETDPGTVLSSVPLPPPPFPELDPDPEPDPEPDPDDPLPELSSAWAGSAVMSPMSSVAIVA
jgi:hypothetical protein